MQLSRRLFLRLSLFVGLVVGLAALVKQFFWSTLSRPPEFATLAAYLDTLIPEDESPSASQVGVTEQLLAKAEKSRRYKRIIQRGCAWLDEQARTQGAAGFAALSEAKRELIVSLAADGTAGFLPIFFFNQTKDDAFSCYYAHPKSWRGLGYAGPPQPLGFMNYTQAPEWRPYGRTRF